MPLTDDRFARNTRESIRHFAGSQRAFDLALNRFECRRTIAKELPRREIEIGGDPLRRLTAEIAALDDLQEPGVLQCQGLFYDLDQRGAATGRRFGLAKRLPEKVLIEAVRRSDASQQRPNALV